MLALAASLSASVPEKPAVWAWNLYLGGAWQHLVDGDAMLEALDRLGREGPSTPPIISIE